LLLIGSRTHAGLDLRFDLHRRLLSAAYSIFVLVSVAPALMLVLIFIGGPGLGCPWGRLQRE
jgi:hypothetical protein